MPNHPDDKKRALTRLHRIRGQCEGVERALAAGEDCGPILQQIAAIRGAVNGLMAEVFEAHLRDTLGPDAPPPDPARLNDLLTLVRSYLK